MGLTKDTDVIAGSVFDEKGEEGGSSPSLVGRRSNAWRRRGDKGAHAWTLANAFCGLKSMHTPEIVHGATLCHVGACKARIREDQAT